MGHCRLKIIFFSFFITTCCYYSNACGIVGTYPGLFYYGWVRDVDAGIIWRNETTDVIAITGYSLNNETNWLYLGVQLIGSKFELFTTEYFKDYEEYEVLQSMTVQVSYDCTGNNNIFPQFISIYVNDTNNNPPTFLPSNEYVINIAAPMPPGYEITGCGYGIIVRDIDLTTQKIIFEIQDNPYFEIEKEIHRNSSTPKEFKAIIRTKSFIRSFPEELKLTIWATDDDLTENKPRTKEATITFLGNDFVLPEEPVFSETFYLADYTDDNQVVLTKPITLKSGYDKHVQFNIKGDYSNFKLVEDKENKISIHVVKALAEEVLTETNIHLIVTADRELTSGASATVVLRLPEVVPLDFQRSHYKGKIEDNNLDAPPLILSQGYEDTAVNATVINAYSSYFSANVEGDTITLSMTTLQESIILDNNFLNLEVLATNGRSTARTIVTLEIVKDDNVTPVFNKPIYIGSYSPTGLILEKIELVQGYEEVNSVDLHGDDKKYFRAVLNGATVTIEAETIPPAIYSQERVVLTLEVMKPRTVGASATIIINLPAPRVMEFEASTHRGSIKNNALTLDPIRLAVGYDNSVVFTITGDYAKYFQVTNGQNPAIITPEPDIPSDVILNNNVIFLTVVASGLNAVTTTTSVILDIIKDDTTTPVFSSNIYYGTYLDILNFDIQNIHLTQGSDGDVTFKLDGDHAQYFNYSIKGNDVVVYPRSVIPQEVIFEKKVLVFNILAMKALTVGASAAISIRFPPDLTDQVILSFAQSTYTGTLASNDLTIDGSINLSAGYAPGTEFILTGEFSEHFNALPNEEVLTLTLLDTLPVEARERAFIVLEIEARRDRAVSAWTSVVIEVVRQEIVPPVFDQTYYRGAYNAESGLRFTQVISLSQGFDDTVHFTLDGALISLFTLTSRDSNSLIISAPNPIPSDVLQAHSQILFAVVATKPGALTARSAVSIDIEKDLTDRVILAFAQSTYTGTLASNGLTIDGSIKLSAGYAPGTEFILTGEFSEHFNALPNEDVLTLMLLDTLPVEARERAFIVLEIEARRDRAVSAWTSVVIEVVRQEIVPPVFEQAYYRGAYNAESGLRFTQVISLSQGFDDTVHFTLDGELISLFVLSSRDSNSLLISAANPIPSDVLQAHSQILFAVVATKPGALTARSAVSIDIEKDLQVGDDVSFDRVLYRGVLQLDEVRHDVIRVYGYVGIVDIIGAYSNMFETSVSGGRVTVRALGSLSLPADVTYLTLELNAASARAVLLLNVVESGGTLEPTVTFSSETYRLSVDITQTGFVGRVSASANTGEDLTYSLEPDDAHLQTHLFINNEGELHLSAPANSGVYTFQVIATTVSSKATGTAWVHLTAQAVTVCDDNGIVMPPLIILERDEEAPHSNLVVLDSTQHAGCHFTLTNRWPTDQTWLYVNEFGLHTNAIDREHASIAFMALSQVQVELTLHCRSDNDNAIRKKRSKTTERLGPYDYGSNKWILTDTIPYNSRRSLVNLIVKDINDNDPIFVGIEHQPIAVGYPTAELEERILPRSLAELQATDADIGENAALRYWSDETVLAVAPTTGFVHVRTGARLTHDQILEVSATDENGQGRTGTIQLIVKLLDLNHIAVVTIRDAFLSDEPTILAQLSNAIGYEVKVLRSVVISDDIYVDVTRNKREVGTRGASLQLYVYGIDQREAVTVDRLTANISANAAIAGVVSTISLEDHLQDMNILDHQIGLLVATIILGVLLFVVILLVAIWFFLRWRKANNHKEFHDESSISNNSSLGELPKPETEQPRLNIEDLRRSERRLQEMLQAPIEQVTVEPMPKKTETPVEAILDLPINEPSAPIVIQSIDKLKDAEESSDDEFGEISPNRRKSVVTFNENVEKIIHVEDNADDDGDGDDANINPSIDASNSGFEIYRL